MVIAGIATFIEVHGHPYVPATPAEGEGERALTARQELLLGHRATGPHSASGISPTAHDLLHIGAWALVILGALTIVLGLIRYWTAAHRVV